jgi:predicted Ser/Thr protein kinase
MDNDLLRRDNGKLSDEARGFKAEVDSLKKRLHEVEQENRFQSGLKFFFFVAEWKDK